MEIRIDRIHGMYVLRAVQDIPVPADTAWAFFANPGNLNALTPQEMHFRITSEPAQTMYAGQIITYRIRLMPGFVTSWVTEITHVHEGHYFIDEQREGPYRLWHHEHRFEAMDGATRMTDKVVFIPPFGILGDLFFKIFFLKRVRNIFIWRHQTLKNIFPS